MDLMNNTNNIYYYSPDTWHCMKMLKGGISFMETANSDGKFDIAIRKESTLLKEFIRDGNARSH